MRILIPLICLFLFSCTKETVPFAPPSATEGGWKLKGTNELAAPEWMTRLGLVKATTARYSGPIEIEAEIFEMRSDASALECTQLWKRRPDESHFNRGNLFIVLRSPQKNREMLMDFGRALEKAL
jgi:hypothetical protein